MRRLLIGLTIVLAFGLTATAAMASSPHFKKNGSPRCTISGGATSKSVTCSASIAGLGNGDVDITVTASGFAVYQCQNGGGNTAPGQNRVLIGPAIAPTHIDDSEIKNGNLSFTTNPAVLSAPSTVSGAAAGCPNPNWTGVNPNVTITDITLEIEQGGVTVFTCTASNPNGLSGTVALSC